MTQIEDFEKQLKRLERKKSYDECMKYVKYLMYKAVERNQIGRAMERAIDNNVDAETNKKIYKDFIQEMFFKGDEFCAAEKKFIDEVLDDDDLAESSTVVQ